MQGSEIDTVVYVLGSPIYQDWRHVYTAVTRGVQQVIVIHDPNHLKKVVTVNKPFQRMTKLGEFLTTNLSTPSIHLGGETHLESPVSCLRTQRDGYSKNSNPKYGALTIRPHSHYSPNYFCYILQVQPPIF